MLLPPPPPPGPADRRARERHWGGAAAVGSGADLQPAEARGGLCVPASVPYHRREQSDLPCEGEHDDLRGARPECGGTPVSGRMQRRTSARGSAVLGRRTSVRESVEKERTLDREGEARRVCGGEEHEDTEGRPDVSGHERKEKGLGDEAQWRRGTGGRTCSLSEKSLRWVMWKSSSSETAGEASSSGAADSTSIDGPYPRRPAAPQASAAAVKASPPVVTASAIQWACSAATAAGADSRGSVGLSCF